MLRVIYTDSSLESSDTSFFKLDSFVPGFRPKCSSNRVFFVSKWVVKRRRYMVLFKLSRRFSSYSKFACIRFHIDWIVRSTNPVPVCRFGVPYLRIMLYSLQKRLYSFEIEALPLSDLIAFSTP